ncbi:MAG: hypothetical protein DRJ28_01505 [Actinobacteria bacterium]|nr:MAG: hypothetical protein DRJ28_01505 [Actinomycetota bacterium]
MGNDLLLESRIVNTALVIAVLLAVILAIWQTIQIQAVRRKVDAVPRDGNVVALLRSIDERSQINKGAVEAVSKRVTEVEGRLPFAISYVGVVAYNAFGNITGNQSRSIALLNERGDGLVITLLASREETVFYTKEVRGGKGLEQLSPEERAAVERALGR